MFSTDGCCTELLLVVIKCVKCGIGLLFWYHTVPICTVDSWHDITYTSVNIRSAPTVHCIRLLFIVITVNECCTSSPVHAHNGTANCTVGHDWEALLLLGKNAFNANSIKEITFPFRVPHCIHTKYIVCATSVPHKCQIISTSLHMIFAAYFAVLYIHTYMLQ